MTISDCSGVLLHRHETGNVWARNRFPTKCPRYGTKPVTKPPSIGVSYLSCLGLVFSGTKPVTFGHEWFTALPPHPGQTRAAAAPDRPSAHSRSALRWHPPRLFCKPAFARPAICVRPPQRRHSVGRKAPERAGYQRPAEAAFRRG